MASLKRNDFSLLSVLSAHNATIARYRLWVCGPCRLANCIWPVRISSCSAMAELWTLCCDPYQTIGQTGRRKCSIYADRKADCAKAGNRDDHLLRQRAMHRTNVLTAKPNSLCCPDAFQVPMKIAFIASSWYRSECTLFSRSGPCERLGAEAIRACSAKPQYLRSVLSRDTHDPHSIIVRMNGLGHETQFLV